MKKQKPIYIKKVNPYDLNSLHEADRFRQKPKWVDWSEKPDPYDLSKRKNKQGENR